MEFKEVYELRRLAIQRKTPQNQWVTKFRIQHSLHNTNSHFIDYADNKVSGLARSVRLTFHILKMSGHRV